MNLLLAFLPWLVFGALSHRYPLAALAVALLITAVQAAIHWRSPKLLELVSLSFFVLDFIAIYFLHWQAIAHHQGLIVHLLLAATAWGSILAGVPFTLQYARESVPREFWHLPQFLRTNQWITAVWGTDFVLQACVMEWQAALGGLLPSLLSVVLTVASVGFTVWYPLRVRQRAQAKAAATRGTTSM